MSFHAALHVARALLVVTSLCALGTWVLWTWFPGYVGRQDFAWRFEYEMSHKERYQEGLDALSGGDAERGLRVLEALAEDLEPIQKRDRLDQVKRNTLSRLMSAHAGRGELERAALHADALAAFDDRDLGHAVTRALLLERVPGREHEAEEILVGLLRRIPNLHAATVEYAKYLLRHDRYGEAVDATLRAVDEGLTEVPLEGWSGYWDSGTGFRGVKRQGLTLEPTRDPTEFWCTLKIPAKEPGIRGFRLDLPPGVFVRLRVLKLGFVAGEVTELLDGLRDFTKSQQIDAVDGFLVAEGGRDAWTAYSLPESLHALERVTVRVHATIEPRLPRALRELVQEPERLEELRGWFEARGRLGDFERFVELARV